MKRFLKTVLILLLIAALAYGGLTLYRQQQSKETENTGVQYVPVSVTTGSLSREVISTGSLTIPRSERITAPAAVTVDAVQVRSGQQVAAGDVLATLDAASVQAAIAAAKSELETLDATLVSLASGYESQQTLYVPIKGRVKQLYAHKGDRVQDVVAAHGCLYVLSLDGKMSVQVPLSEETVLGARLSVMNSAGNGYAAAVVAVDDSHATLTFSDLAAEAGETVTVYLTEEKTVTAECAIHMPLEVSTTVNGVVTTELLRPNKYCDKKDSAFVVSYMEPEQAYYDALAQRQDLVEQLAALQTLAKEPVLKSETDGIVNTITVGDGMAAAAGDELFTLYTGLPDTMTISVDELDIIHVQEGQTATVSMDAITDKVYNATVTYLSTLGTASSGITGYDVTVQLEADEQLKLGMNGTVTIAVGQQENALLVPLAALQSDARGSYVWLYSAEHTATEEAPGVKTYVNTGLSNEDHAAVTGGLRAGDQVLVVRTAAAADSGEGQSVDIQMPGGEMPMPGSEMQMPGGGMQMPGGERPEGGFTRPGGSSGGGRTGNGSGSGTGGGRTAPGGN